MKPLGQSQGPWSGKRSRYWHRRRPWEADFNAADTWLERLRIAGLLLLMVLMGAEFGYQLYSWIGG